jgi:hypothetical protein
MNPLLFGPAIADTQTDDIMALRKVLTFEPEFPDDATIAEESEPEEQDPVSVEPEAAEGASSPRGRSTTRAVSSPKKASKTPTSRK